MFKNIFDTASRRFSETYRDSENIRDLFLALKEANKEIEKTLEKVSKENISETQRRVLDLWTTFSDLIESTSDRMTQSELDQSQVVAGKIKEIDDQVLEFAVEINKILLQVREKEMDEEIVMRFLHDLTDKFKDNETLFNLNRDFYLSRDPASLANHLNVVTPETLEVALSRLYLEDDAFEKLKTAIKNR